MPPSISTLFGFRLLACQPSSTTTKMGTEPMPLAHGRSLPSATSAISAKIAEPVASLR